MQWFIFLNCEENLNLWQRKIQVLLSIKPAAWKRVVNYLSYLTHLTIPRLLLVQDFHCSLWYLHDITPTKPVDSQIWIELSTQLSCLSMSKFSLFLTIDALIASFLRNFLFIFSLQTLHVDPFGTCCYHNLHNFDVFFDLSRNSTSRHTRISQLKK